MTPMSPWMSRVIPGCLVLLLVATPANAQPTAKKEASGPTLKMITLQYVSAPEVEKIVRKLLGDEFFADAARLVPDNRTNSLLVFGKEHEIATIAKLVQTLDLPAAPQPPQRPATDEVLVFELKNQTIGQGLEAMLRVLLPTPDEGSFALDPAQRRVLVRGRGERLQAVRALLARLEDNQPPAQPVPDEVQLRVVWLATTKEDPKGEGALGESPPADLGEVVKELEKVGFIKPRMIAQTMINTGTNQRFTVQGSTRFLTPCTLQIQGMLGEKSDAGRMVDLTISALPIQQKQQAPLCNLGTQITAPQGHPVVLGVTVADGVSSAFVVQILPKKTAPRGK